MELERKGIDLGEFTKNIHLLEEGGEKGGREGCMRRMTFIAFGTNYNHL